MYIRELCRIVIICCKEDSEFETYPLIDVTNTTHFKSPTIFVAPDVASNSLLTKKHNQFQHCISHCGTLVFRQIPPDGLSYPALILTTEYIVLESDEDLEDDCSSEETDPPPPLTCTVYLIQH